MVKEATRSLGAAVSGAVALWRADVDGRSLGPVIVSDQPERLVAGEQQFNSPDDDAAERVKAGASEACRLRRFFDVGGQGLVIEAVACHRAGQVGPAIERRVERGGVFHLELLEVLVVFGWGDVQAARR